jgi:hypothetical protein
MRAKLPECDFQDLFFKFGLFSRLKQLSSGCGRSPVAEAVK